MEKEELQDHNKRRAYALVGLHTRRAERAFDMANDLEQTLARVYHTLKGIIQHTPELQREAEVHTKTIYLANGDILQEAFGGSWVQPTIHGRAGAIQCWTFSARRSRLL